MNTYRQVVWQWLYRYTEAEMLAKISNILLANRDDDDDDDGRR